MVQRCTKGGAARALLVAACACAAASRAHCVVRVPTAEAGGAVYMSSSSLRRRRSAHSRSHARDDAVPVSNKRSMVTRYKLQRRVRQSGAEATTESCKYGCDSPTCTRACDSMCDEGCDTPLGGTAINIFRVACNAACDKGCDQPKCNEPGCNHSCKCNACVPGQYRSSGSCASTGSTSLATCKPCSNMNCEASTGLAPAAAPPIATTAPASPRVPAGNTSRGAHLPPEGRAPPVKTMSAHPASTGLATAQVTPGLSA